MYKIETDESTRLLKIEVTGDISRTEYDDILYKLTSILNNNIKYKFILTITKYKFYFWQLPYIMKVKRLGASTNVEKMAIVIDKDLARGFGIRAGVQDYENQIVFYTMEEANAYLEQ